MFLVCNGAEFTVQQIPKVLEGLLGQPISLYADLLKKPEEVATRLVG